MANEAVALIALALLLSLDQWASSHIVAHVDPHLIPAASRRRVRWLVLHSARVHLVSAGLVAVGVALEAAVLLR